MPERVSVELARDTHLILRGGDPRGSDAVHRTVSGWPGWRRLPGKSSLEGRPVSLYTARLWPHTALPLAKVTWTVLWEPAATAAVRACLDHMKEAGRCLELPRPTALHGPRHPMPHQLGAIQAIAAMQNCVLLADDMGLGKTSTALWAFAESRNTRLLVVCPKSVKLNWRAEVAATLGPPEQIPCYVVDGTASQRATIFAAMRHYIDMDGDPLGIAVAVVNYDLLRLLPDQHAQIIRQWTALEAVVLDESHYIKDHKAKRTQAVLELCKGASMRIAMSGTPIRNTVADLYSQIEFVRPGSWCSPSDFMNRYLVQVPTKLPNVKRKIMIVRGSKNVAELSAVVNTLQISRRKEDVLDLPPRITTKPLLELEAPLTTVYKAMKELALVELSRLCGPGDAPATRIFDPVARSGMEAAMRCEQIACGFLGGIPDNYLAELAPMLVRHGERIDGVAGAVMFPLAPKIVWLLETIDEVLGADRQLVVFSRFNAPLLWLFHQFSDSAGLLTGDVDTLARQDVLDSFARKESRLLLCQVKLAEGFNLATANDVVFLGRDWSPAINAQAEARCHRIGTKGTVNIQIPLVVNTIERMIDKKLSHKEADAEQALRNVSVQELMEAL
jgi:SNF2 family DNA or RNA helicase